MSAREILEANRPNIIQNYENGVSLSEIGREIGVNHASVSKFLRDECGVSLRTKNWDAMKDDIVARYNAGDSAYRIARDLNMAANTLGKLFRSWGLELKIRKISKNLNAQAADIIKDYNAGTGCENLGKKYNCSGNSILQLLHKYNVTTGINQRKHHFDERYFQIIDTPEKAYILGFIIGDGNVHIRSLKIKITDLELLEKMRVVMDIVHIPISTVKMNKSSEKTAYVLALNSKVMFDDLARLGVVPDKTFLVKFPTEDQVPTHLIPHYLRGLLDADGTITSAGGGGSSWTASYVGNEPLMIGIANFIQENFHFSTRIVSASRTCDQRIKRLDISNKEVTRKFLDLLYKDSTIHLDRKYQRYQYILQGITPAEAKLLAA